MRDTRFGLVLVEKPLAERVAKICHGAADPMGSGRTSPDEETH
jgi:hypothetical protein